MLPDVWQQQSVRALREGRDVVVHAPTGAGKTYIFELFHGSLRGQAVFTVPTRALANDKLSEWRARGWDVGICTGDIAERLDAPVVVATLETQRGKFLRGEGPALLVIDEYQMIGDPVRGLNYELALALAPRLTQLLLLSGSVANPDSVVQWLGRIGRNAVLISHERRPVPLEEVDFRSLPDRAKAHGFWPRAIANALLADLGPILLFAPLRNAAEELAHQLAAALPQDAPLHLTPEQIQIAGPQLTKLLRARVAFHHSGLSYAQRAGVIEPLAKTGQLRVVVATMGLAAGINFSMRSVAVTGSQYKSGNFEHQVQPDELLQMFGRAGRRGLDETGYALVHDRTPRLLEARRSNLRRPQALDWPSLLSVMRFADEPFKAASALIQRLFTPVALPLGVERALATGPMPCHLHLDMERVRFFRRGSLEMLNSQNQWQLHPEKEQSVSAGKVLVRVGQSWLPLLGCPKRVAQLGFGSICRLGGRKRYGREVVVGQRTANGTLRLAPWLRKLLSRPHATADELQKEILPGLANFYARASKGQRAEVESLFPTGDQLRARFSFEQAPVTAWLDSCGVFLSDPPQRRNSPAACNGCSEIAQCARVPIVYSPAFEWRRLCLIEPDGKPTRRGIIFSFFSYGEGLAIAAALEDETYSLGELVFDLANLRAGERFAGDESRYGGRLGNLCQQVYGRTDIPGCMELGVPIHYGAGASEVVRALMEHRTPRQKLLTQELRQGDLERVLVEWRSLLRHIASAPDYSWERWQQFKERADAVLKSSDGMFVAPRI